MINNGGSILIGLNMLKYILYIVALQHLVIWSGPNFPPIFDISAREIVCIKGICFLNID